jgi:16S rRNA (cytidine1402-2'-O)-methyltransferase
LAEVSETLIFYEAPHRVIEMLEDVRKAFGDCPVVIGREVTKIHEEFLRGTLSEVVERLQKKPVKGEITVLVAPQESSRKTRPARSVSSVREEMESLMRKEKLSEREALKVLARSKGISKSEVYRRWQAEKGP